MLKGIATGDPASVEVVDEARYVQHNPMTKEGSIGLAELFKKLSQTSPRVEIIRAFEDGDFVFAQVEYDFAEHVTGFEVFRFEGGFAVEHWDNLQPLAHAPNPSGRSMNDGQTEIDDLDQTEANRAVATEFVDVVLVGRQLAALDRFVSADLAEHDPMRGDGVVELRDALAAQAAEGGHRLRYDTVHRILAEGNFVLVAAEGAHETTPSAIYDLFRLSAGVIVEHWGSIEEIPPREVWNNDNGKF
jgi:predicted SnoaL-like aldol condensation-catalyzing enzyme